MTDIFKSPIPRLRAKVRLQKSKSNLDILSQTSLIPQPPPCPDHTSEIQEKIQFLHWKADCHPIALNLLLPESLLKYQSLPELLHYKSDPTSIPSTEWDEMCDYILREEENECAAFKGNKECMSHPFSSDSLNIRKHSVIRACTKCGMKTQSIEKICVCLLPFFGTHEMDMLRLDILIGNDLIPLIGLLIFQDLSLFHVIDEKALFEFLQHIQSRYVARNPFHNACHAADVMHTMYTILLMSTLRNSLSSHIQVAALLAAVLHDIEHVGLSNAFLTKSRHDIAIRYASCAPMEAMHASVANSLLRCNDYHMLDKIASKKREEIVQLVKETILSTALCNQKELLRQVSEIPEQQWEAQTGMEGTLSLSLQVLVMRLILHVCDLGQTTKPFPVHQKWAHRLIEEQFLEGDVDKRMRFHIAEASCDRAKWDPSQFYQSQIGFMQGFALPAMKTLKNIPNVCADVLIAGVEENILNWKARLQRVRQTQE